MARRLGRRTVYIGTIVGALALVAGFALAAGLTTTSVNANQNGYSANVGNTVWYGSTITLAPSASSATCSATTADTPSSPASGSNFPVTLGSNTAVSIYYGVSASGCSATDFAEAFTFVQSFSSAATDTNTFIVYADWTPQGGSATNAAVAYTLPMSITGSGTSQVTVNLVIDFGSNAPPASTAGLNVVVTGS